jgi:hypothetical protein
VSAAPGELAPPVSRAPLRAATGLLARVLVPLLAVVLFVATFHSGIVRGMDRMVGYEAWGRVATAVAIVFTEEKYGTGGYAVSNCLFNELLARGFTADPAVVAKFGMTAPENLRSGAYLDGILERMWRELPGTPDCRGGFRGFGADDLGFTDFTRLAFWIFGVHVRSFYYLFFLLYGASLGLALLERRGDRVGQGILVGIAALVYATCFYSNLMFPEPPGLGNMLNPRFMPVIGLVPMVHLLLVTIHRAPVTVAQVAIVVFQSALVFFALHIRATAAWLVAALAIAVGAILLVDLVANGAPVALRGALRHCWPALLALAIVVAGTQVVSLSLHPVYRQEGWLQHHAFWHSVYYSLAFHPKYMERFSAMHDGALGDEMPVAAARRYLRNHPDEDSAAHYFPGTKSLKYSAMETLVRRAFFEFAREHPRFVLETFFVAKPRHMWRAIRQETRVTWRTTPPTFRLLFLAGLLGIGVASAAESLAFARLRLLAAILSLGAVASLVVPFLTVTNLATMSEAIMAVQLAGMVLLVLAAAAAARAVRAWVGSPGTVPGLVSDRS